MQGDPRLEPLFARLKTAADPAEAAPVEAGIWQVWSEIADPTSAGLLARGTEALARRDQMEARDAFDALIQRSPDFAEAWNKRATLHYVIGDYRASVEDIQHVLALEPRHFGALSGLGLIYAAINRPEAAMRSFEAALAINPFLTGAKAQVERLRGRIEGDPT